jgi:hypothetical protein
MFTVKGEDSIFIRQIKIKYEDKATKTKRANKVKGKGRPMLHLRGHPAHFSSSS